MKSETSRESGELYVLQQTGMKSATSRESGELYVLQQTGMRKSESLEPFTTHQRCSRLTRTVLTEEYTR